MKKGIFNELGVQKTTSKIKFNNNEFYEYILASFLKSQNIKTDDIFVDNVSDAATVKKVDILKAFVDLHFSNLSSHNGQYLFNSQTDEISTEGGLDDVFLDDFLLFDSKKENERTPFVEYVIKKEIELAKSENNNKQCTHTIFLQGKAGAGKSTLTQFIALWNWALWLSKNNVKKIVNDAVKGFLSGNQYNAYINEFETKESVPYTFRLRLSDFDKYLSNILQNDAFLSLATVIHFIAFTIWLNITRKNEEKIEYSAWGEAALSENTLAKNICQFCEDLITSNKPIVFLFDGLDEVKFERDELISTLKNFINNNAKNENSRNLAIVTSRMENVKDLLEEKVENVNSEPSNQKPLFDESCRLTDLNNNKVEQCVQQFCDAKYDGETARKTYSAIMNSYKNKSKTKDLMKTPLEVTMVCLVYQGSNEIPENDAKLYKSYIDMYYNREKERLKLNNSNYKDFYEQSCTKDTIYHILEWAGYQLEFGEDSSLSWEQVVNEAKHFNLNEDGVLKYKVMDDDYFDKIGEVSLTRLNLLNLTNDNRYDMDEVHKTVKEFLAAQYIVSPENEMHFEKNMIRIVLLEKKEVFNFIMWTLTSYPLKEQLFRSNVLLDFNENEDKNIVQICESINIGCRIVSNLLDSYIYKIKNPETTIMKKLATYVDTDSTIPKATDHIISLLNDNNARANSNILGHIDEFIETHNAITVNLFKVLVEIINENICVDPITYPHIDEILNSDDFGKNILRNAKKYETKISEEFLSKVLKKCKSIDASENSDELLCDNLEKIKYIEAVRQILSRKHSIISGTYAFLNEQLGSYSLFNKEKELYTFSSEDRILSLKYTEYDWDDFVGVRAHKKKYLSFVEKVRGYKLEACADLLNCMANLTYLNMFKYAKNLPLDEYRKELSQMFGDDYVNNLSRENFPALVLTRRVTKKQTSEQLVEIIKSAFPKRSNKKFKDNLSEFKDAIELCRSKFPCSITCHCIEGKIDRWLDAFDYVYNFTKDNKDNTSVNVLAFLFSAYEWSCQHGRMKIKYDDIHSDLQKYQKDIFALLFEENEILSGMDHIYLLHYVLSSNASDYIDLLKKLPIQKLYECFPKYLTEQMNLSADRNEGFLSSESYSKMLDFLNSLTFAGAKEYWDFFVKTFLLIRNSKEFIVTFSFSSRPNKKEDAYQICNIIDLIQDWYRHPDRENNNKFIAAQIINSINRIKNEDKSTLLEMIINYLVYNFEEKLNFNLSSLLIELLKKIHYNDEFYSSRKKIRNILEKLLKTQI